MGNDDVKDVDCEERDEFEYELLRCEADCECRACSTFTPRFVGRGRYRLPVHLWRIARASQLAPPLEGHHDGLAPR
jgi:hypothetical protein